MSDKAELKERGHCALVVLVFSIIFYFMGFYFEKSGQNVGGGIVISSIALVALIITIIYSSALLVLYIVEARKRPLV